MNRKDALLKAEKYDAKLRADDPRFCRHIMVIGINDATVLNFANAFAMKDENWHYVFTEHNGLHLFHKSEYNIIHFKRIFDDDYLI